VKAKSSSNVLIADTLFRFIQTFASTIGTSDPGRGLFVFTG